MLRVTVVLMLVVFFALSRSVHAESLNNTGFDVRDHNISKTYTVTFRANRSAAIVAAVREAAVSIKVFDSDGRLVASDSCDNNDGAPRAIVVTFVPPATAQYRVRVESTNNKGIPSHVRSN